MPEVIINGDAGKIEGRYTRNPDHKAPAVLVLHPHPLHGGTMNNKITYHLYRSFVNHGFSALRINFRGVGKTEGIFTGGEGEIQDVAVALNWLHNQNMDASSYWIAGFSFGAYVGLHATMRRPDIEGYIFVAPPVTKYDFGFIAPCSASGLIIQGGDDSISKEKDTAKIIDKLTLKEESEVEYKIIPKADHFFRENMVELDEIINSYIKERLTKNLGEAKKVKRDRRRRRKKKIHKIDTKSVTSNPVQFFSFDD